MRSFRTLTALSFVVACVAGSVLALRTSLDTRTLADVCASVSNTAIKATIGTSSVTGECSALL